MVPSPPKAKPVADGSPPRALKDPSKVKPISGSGAIVRSPVARTKISPADPPAKSVPLTASFTPSPPLAETRLLSCRVRPEIEICPPATPIPEPSVTPSTFKFPFVVIVSAVNEISPPPPNRPSCRAVIFPVVTLPAWVTCKKANGLAAPTDRSKTTELVPAVRERLAPVVARVRSPSICFSKRIFAPAG